MHSGNAPASPKPRKDLEIKVPITTTIPLFMWKACREQGFALNHIFRLGYQVATNTQPIIERTGDLEKQVEKLNIVIDKLKARQRELEDARREE